MKEPDGGPDSDHADLQNVTSADEVGEARNQKQEEQQDDKVISMGQGDIDEEDSEEGARFKPEYRSRSYEP